MKYRFVILPLILSLLAFYTHLNLDRIFPDSGDTNWTITLMVFAFMVGSQIVYRLRGWPRQWMPGKAFVWLGSVIMGLWASFVLLSMAADLLYGLILILEGLLPARLMVNEAQVQYAQHILLSVLLAVSFITAFIGLWQAISGPRVKSITIPSDSTLNGFTIAQISDLHIGATIHQDYVGRVVAKTMALAPDIIVITGDIADGTPNDLRPYLSPLSQLKAQYGVYFITGNHEYYSGVEAWLGEARANGYITLLNENRIITYNNTKLMIAGVTDISAHNFIPEHRSDPTKAIASAEATAFKILLAHQPESCFEAEKAGFDLQLSGHTHAGQFFPFNLLVRAAKRYYRGLQKHGKMWLYINPGTGYWGAANRFLVPSEITLIRLSGK